MTGRGWQVGLRVAPYRVAQNSRIGPGVMMVIAGLNSCIFGHVRTKTFVLGLRDEGEAIGPSSWEVPRAMRARRTRGGPGVLASPVSHSIWGAKTLCFQNPWLLTQVRVAGDGDASQPVRHDILGQRRSSARTSCRAGGKKGGMKQESREGKRARV